MRAIISPEQMRSLDDRTINEAGIPGIVLMELASRGVMLEVERILGGHVDGARALVFCGSGNNGGDGFAVARRFLNAEADAIVYLFAERSKITGDALTNMTIFENLGGQIIEVKEKSDLDNMPMADVVIDALLGTGITGAAHGIIASGIEVINSFQIPVVSVDIPSGINAATGYAEGPAVRADITATFGEIKIGHLISPGLEHSGRISRVDIQIPPKYLEELEAPLYLAEANDVYNMLPQRSMDAHKGDAGKVLVVAGSVGMTGAAELASKSCLRSGAGLVKVATAKDAQAILAGKTSEIMTIPVANTEEGSIAPEAETTIDEARKWADVEVIGPGLSLNPETVKWFHEHAEDLPLPTVIDADGLNALSQNQDLMMKLNEEIVLTPHIGEFARLTGLSSEEIAKNRVNLVKEYATKWNVTLLLKGVPTLVGVPNGPVYAILAGNPGMATAGMGDVLTGVIAGLMAQGLNGMDACIAGTTIHGLAGNLAVQQLGNTGIVSSDVVERLPLAQDIVAGRAQYPSHGHGGGCGCGSGGGGGCGGGGGDCGCDDDECGCGSGGCGC
jgi:NAD(P)H-hydrate epimerase